MRCLLAICVLGLGATLAPAQTVLFDSGGFEAGAGYSVGALTGTAAGTAGQNGWVREVANTAIFNVQNTVAAGGAGQAVQVNSGATNWAYPVLNYTPAAGDIVRIQADIARTVSATTPSFGYGIDVYSIAGARTTRFGLAVDGTGAIRTYVTAPFNTTTSQFQAGQPVANVLVGTTTFAANAFVSFDAQLNYATRTFNLLVNGASVGSIPFADAAATTLADADFQVSSNATAIDTGYLDNYRVTVVPVPEPASCALAAFAATGVATLRRRRRMA